MAVLNAALANGATDNVQIELARADALAGNLDAARARVRSILALSPNSLEALSVLAYVETRLQDYGVAADLYRRALAIQNSPALREALAEVTRREGSVASADGRVVIGWEFSQPCLFETE